MFDIMEVGVLLFLLCFQYNFIFYREGWRGDRVMESEEMGLSLHPHLHSILLCGHGKHYLHCPAASWGLSAETSELMPVQTTVVLAAQRSKSKESGCLPSRPEPQA